MARYEKKTKIESEEAITATEEVAVPVIDTGVTPLEEVQEVEKIEEVKTSVEEPKVEDIKVKTKNTTKTNVQTLADFLF